MVAVLVFSVVAPAVSGHTSGDSATQPATAQQTFSEERATSQGTTNETLQATNGTVEVLVQVTEIERKRASSAVNASSTLREHAERTQQPVISFAKSHSDAITVKQQLWLSNTVLLEVDTSRVRLKELAAVSGVERLSPNRRYYAPDEKSSSSESASAVQNTTYGLDQINATEVWDAHDTKGDGVKVAVLDSGIALDHPDLELHTDDASDPTYPGGWAEFNTDGEQVPDSEPSAVCGDHGTHTSGTVAGGKESGEWIGVAPDAELMHGAVLTEQSLLGCGGSTVEVIAGMQWAVTNDADVISMSLGGPADGSMVSAVRNADAAGSLVVGAIGNSGPGTIGSPGAVYESISVGATNEALGVPEFSGGAEIDTSETFPDAPAEWPDSYVAPDVAAPGAQVKSSVPGGGYDSFSGTSMATPHVAGVAALLLSIGGEEMGPDQVKRTLYQSAFKPADCSPSCSPRDGNDTRYGTGIVDAYAAAQQLQTIPEHELGDVDASGSITVQDVQRLQQHLAGTLDSDATFNENLADLDRDGSITYDDLQLLQLKLRGDITPGQLQLSNLSAPETIDHGETATVTATVTNPGDEGVYDTVAYQFDSNERATTPVELQPGESTTVTFSLETNDYAPGTYDHGVVSADDSANGSLTIAGANFAVSEFAAPDAVEQGTQYSVSATVHNDGNEPDTRAVHYRRDGVTVATQNVTLESGASTQVTFEDLTVTSLRGTITHGVATADDTATETITVRAGAFSITETQAPENVTAGESYGVNVTITNTGNAGDTQQVEYTLAESPPSVAVVDSDEGYGPQVASALNATLPEGYTVTLVKDANATAAIDSHDVFVMQDVSPTALDVPAFVDATNDAGVGVVWLDNWGSDSDAIEERSNAVGDPASTDQEDAGNAPVAYTVTESHPILEGLGGPGEQIPIHQANFGDRSWYENYSGQTIATVSASGSSAGGPALGVDADSATVLAGTLGREYFVENGDFTPEADAVLANAVTWANDVATVSGHSRQSNGANETVTLEPGASTTVTLTNTPPSSVAESQDWQHVFSTDDETVSKPVTVRPPTGGVGGMITSAATGDPVQNATVTVGGENLSRNYTTSTDADGTYSVDDVPVGTHTISVSSDQYQVTARSIAIESGETATVDLSVEPRNGTIGGVVTAADTGDPIQNVTIRLEDDKSSVTTVTTGADGTYEASVEPGYYVVNVADGPPEYGAEQIITVGPNESVTDIDFELTPETGTITGYVTNAAGAPVADAHVIDADGNAFNVTTGEDGSYEIPELDRGTYALRVNGPGYNQTDISFVELGATESVEQNFTVGSYLTVTDLQGPANATHGETITVEATVTNVGTESVSRSVVYFPPGTPFSDGQFTEASDGVQTVTLDGGESTTVTFEYTVEESLSPGEYQHGISADEMASTTITIEGNKPDPAALRVTNVSAPETATPGATIGVNATVSNDGNSTVSGPVSYHFDGELVTTKNVTLSAGATTTVLFDHRLSEATGTFNHSVESETNAVTAELSVEAAGSEPAYFAVSNLTGPDSTAPGETITVNATVTNTGDETGTQSVFLFFMASEQTSSFAPSDVGTAKMTAAFQPTAVQQVSLDGGEQTRLSFTYQVASDASPGEYEYAVSSLQETAVEPVTVAESSGESQLLTPETVTASATG
ncbi:S8 family serine peptidase [Halocatena halophila]|uniref:S8 family serine peptidase n=1 Tax=Halocatena halophila TaxID=2814576 RepID=UPI002ECFB10C